MGTTMSATDEYAKYGYGQGRIGFGKKPAILVVDFQKGFVDPKYPTGGRPLILSAVKATAQLLAAARPRGIPVAQCATAYSESLQDFPHWKVAICRDLILGTEGCEIVEELRDPSYVFLPKRGPSIFFGTPLATMLVRQGVDTAIVTGANTSGCIRATVIDSFSYGFRTIVPVECVGDMEEGPHWANLKDVDRRYADVVPLSEVISYLGTLPR
jgi:maleamate amidohydrolase